MKIPQIKGGLFIIFFEVRFNGLHRELDRSRNFQNVPFPTGDRVRFDVEDLGERRLRQSQFFA